MYNLAPDSYAVAKIIQNKPCIDIDISMWITKDYHAQITYTYGSCGKIVRISGEKGQGKIKIP